MIDANKLEIVDRKGKGKGIEEDYEEFNLDNVSSGSEDEENPDDEEMVLQESFIEEGEAGKCDCIIVGADVVILLIHRSFSYYRA